MDASLILPEIPASDFHARLSRRAMPRGRSHGRKKPVLRGAVTQRLGVLAAAIALPALAVPDSLLGFAQRAEAAPAVKPMGYEIAGESFPGSAFYYLEDVPTLAPQAAITDTAEVPVPTQPSQGTAGFAGPAALPLRISGTPGDHARAQQCLTMAIYYEAASESDAGQRAVAQVVLNRVAHPTYPATVCGVVFQGSERATGCQFSFTCDGSLGRRPSPAFWNRAGRIARQALAGSVYAPVGMATHYHTLAVNPHWAPSLDQVAVIGAHQFYRWPGNAGTREAFTARYRGGEPPAQPAVPLVASAMPASTGHAAAPLDPATLPPAPTEVEATALALPSPATSRLPAGGAIRSEYANSGNWRDTSRNAER